MTTARLQAFVDDQAHCYGLCDWSLEVSQIDAETFVNDTGEHGLLADIEWDYPTRTATIRVAVKQPDAKIKESVVHRCD